MYLPLEELNALLGRNHHSLRQFAQIEGTRTIAHSEKNQSRKHIFDLLEIQTANTDVEYYEIVYAVTTPNYRSNWLKQKLTC